MSVTDPLIAYSLAALLLAITPGLDTALILRTAAVEGSKKALQGTLGINTGCFIWGTFVALGLGAILAASELAYEILKWCGALYLFWLGFKLITRPRYVFDIQKVDNQTQSNWFLRGMLGNVLNPKMGIFYVSFLPQFIPNGQAPIPWTFLLVFIHAFLGTLWLLSLIIATKYATKILKKPVFVKWMDRVTGGVFMLFAAKLALSHR